MKKKTITFRGAASQADEDANELLAIAKQQDQLREHADQIEAGILTDDPMARQLIAFVLRQKADNIKPTKRQRGRPRELFDPGSAAMMVHIKRNLVTTQGGKPLTREEAVGEVALELGVDDRTIGKIYDDHLQVLDVLMGRTAK